MPFSVRRTNNPVMNLDRALSVAIYDNHDDVVKAVDYLSDCSFPVEHLAIVGTDLKSCEKVTGRLSLPVVLAGGFLQGATWAVMFALITSWVNPQTSLWENLSLALIGFGAVGMVISAVQYWIRRGQRDFTSTTALIATRYELLAEQAWAAKARELLDPSSMQKDQRTSCERSYEPVDAEHLAQLPPPYGQEPISKPKGVQDLSPSPLSAVDKTDNDSKDPMDNREDIDRTNSIFAQDSSYGRGVDEKNDSKEDDFWSRPDRS